MERNIRILRLNSGGLPQRWITPEDAAVLYCKGMVEWTIGENPLRLTGGMNSFGERTILDIAPIIACGGDDKRESFVPPLSNALLFRRDGFRCMYCGLGDSSCELTRDHIVPRVQGGPDVWTNVVAACRRCNCAKGGRTPEQAGMDLLAVPFAPNIFEFMYLANRKIRGDQMEYLRARFTGKRCWLAA